MRYTTKTIISKAEYLQLIGLLTLAKAGNEKQKDIAEAVMAITGETDDTGNGSDAVYSDYTADELLEKLDIAVNSNRKVKT